MDNPMEATHSTTINSESIKLDIDPLDPTVGGKYYFCAKSAQHVIDFFEKELTHVEGEWVGKPIILELWQKEFLANVFGWKYVSTGYRRYREAYLEIPRKNGKTLLVAGLALYLLLADKEPNAKVASAAGDKEQAEFLYKAALGMVYQNDKLKRMVIPLKSSITVKDSFAEFKALSSESKTKHGGNLHAGLVDELHVQPNRLLVDVLRTSTAVRRQPLMIYITTAGHDRNSICWTYHQKALAVIANPLYDENMYAMIFCASETDDWKDPEVWKKANPNYGVSVKPEYMEAECLNAINDPTAENSFKQLNLNIWTEQEVRFIPMHKWREVDKIPIDESDLADTPAYCGLDLSMTTDITAFVMNFPNYEKTKMQVLPFFWIPRAKMKERIAKDKVPYDIWEKQGFVRVIEGTRIDNAIIKRDILKLTERFKIKEVAFDPYNAYHLANDLEEAGITMIECPQRPSTMSYPNKEMISWIGDNCILHGGNPVLDFMAKNTVGIEDGKGNIMIHKGKSIQRIDGIVAMVMGLWRILITQNEPDSVYKNRGLIKL